MAMVMRGLLLSLAALFALVFLMEGASSISALATGENGAASRLPMAILAAAMAYGFWKWSKRGAPASGQADRLVVEVVDFFGHVNAARQFPQGSAEKVLTPQDEPVLAACNARLFEIKSSTRSEHLGTRLKLGGMPIYVGKSTPVTKQELRESATGELALTAKTLFFVGSARSLDIALAKVTGVEVLPDGFTITARGRLKPVTFQVPNGLLWAQLLKNVMAIELKGNRLPDGVDLHVR